MKRLSAFTGVWLLLVASVFAGSWLEYDAARRVGFANAPSMYARNEYHWFIFNTGQASDLFMNGIYQESEAGDYDLNLPEAWLCVKQPKAIRLALLDGGTGYHQQISRGVLAVIDPSMIVTLFPIRYYDAAGVAVALNQAVTAGNKIVVMPFGYAASDASLRTAALNANRSNVILVCSLPNAIQDCDELPDYPYSWRFPNIVGVNGVDRAGNHYWSGTGHSAVAAPSRNITGDGLIYSSGTSYSAPMVAGILSLAMQVSPGQPARYYLDALRATSEPIGNVHRVHAVNFLNRMAKKVLAVDVK